MEYPFEARAMKLALTLTIYSLAENGTVDMEGLSPNWDVSTQNERCRSREASSLVGKAAIIISGCLNHRRPPERRPL